MLRNEAASLFRAEKFAALEELADGLRLSREVFRDGMPRLEHFYRGLQPRRWRPQIWSEDAARFESWLAVFPQSRTARIALGDFLLVYSQSGVVHSEADRVERARRRAGLLSRSVQLAESVFAEPDPCPRAASLLLRLSIELAWPREKMEAIYRAAILARPDYLPYAEKKGYYLIHIAPGTESPETGRFLNGACAKGVRDGGPWLVAQVYLQMATSYPAQDWISPGRFEWPALREGFRDLIARRVESTWVLNHFAHLAWRQGDRETATELLRQIGEDPNPEPWGSGGTFFLARRQVGLEAHPGDLASVRTLRWAAPLTRLAISPDGDRLAVGFADGTLRVLSGADGSELFRDRLGQGVDGLAFTEDGSRLAAAGGRWNDSKHDLVEYQTDGEKTYRVRRRLHAAATHFGRIGYRRGTSELFVAGGGGGEIGGRFGLWTESGSAPQDWGLAASYRYSLDVGTLWPDGSRAVLSVERGFVVWDLERREEAVNLHRLLDGYVRALAVSPDGAWLVAGVNRYANAHVRSAWLRRWRTQDWEDWGEIVPESLGGILCLAYSPDGRRLALGGDAGTLRVVDAEEGRELHRGTEHLGELTDLLFHPREARRLFTASEDGTLREWLLPE